MRKKLQILTMAVVLALGLTACGTKKTADNGNSGTEVSKAPAGEESTAQEMTKTGNPRVFQLNGEHVLEKAEGTSWVKIATIWDPELTTYDAESFVAGSKAVVADFTVTGLDVDSTKCYWNYMVVDSAGQEVECWDDTYKTDEITITEDGTYRMVFDYSKVQGGDVAGLKSLQLVFTDMTENTAAKVEVKNALCVTDEKELGSIYTSGKTE